MTNDDQGSASSCATGTSNALETTEMARLRGVGAEATTVAENGIAGGASTGAPLSSAQAGCLVTYASASVSATAEIQGFEHAEEQTPEVGPEQRIQAWLPPPLSSPCWGGCRDAWFHSLLVSTLAGSGGRLFASTNSFLRLPPARRFGEAQVAGHDTAVALRACNYRRCGNETPGVYMTELTCSLQSEDPEELVPGNIRFTCSAGHMWVHTHGAMPTRQDSPAFSMRLMNGIFVLDRQDDITDMLQYLLVGLQITQDIDQLPEPSRWMPLGFVQRLMGRTMLGWNV